MSTADPRPIAAARVTVGLSGGVDSSVAAYLLREQGYAVDALFMKNWREHDPLHPCTAAQDAEDAKEVCRHLGIDFRGVNFSDAYWDKVFQRFLDEHAGGRTPNPDVLCNREIKFSAFLERALEDGADFIATGHYARVQRCGGRYHLLKGADPAKDQSYFLYTLGQAQLARSLFPVGALHKTAVRHIAARAGLATHAKKDSTGICFIGERDFRRFLQHYIAPRPGPICTLDGRTIGTHTGLAFYTIGQRRGLGIGGLRGGAEAAWYVAGKEAAANTLRVVQGRDHPALYGYGVTAADLHWVAGAPPAARLRCTAKTRYRQADQACTVTLEQGARCRAAFDAPQWALTPGQAVVFYQGEECLGGGTIEQVVTWPR